MFTRPLPRYVIPKVRKSDGKTGFFFNVPSAYTKLGCPIVRQPLGTDYIAACGEDGTGGKAAALNARIDEWQSIRRGLPISGERDPIYGTVDWLFLQYKKSKAYTEKVSERSQPDYERNMLLVADTKTNKGVRIGLLKIKAISPEATDKLYERIIVGRRGERLRQGEKVVALCRRAWNVVHRLHPKEFDEKVPNPWSGVTLKRRTKITKPAVTRDQVYEFAWGCINFGRPEIAAAAVICFEWLQRPENVMNGFIRWTDYRSEEWPNAIHIVHHKTGKQVWHPLEETNDEGRTVFYADAEAVLAKLPRRGIPMILREILPSRRNPNRSVLFKTYSLGGYEKAVRTMRDKLGLPSIFTLDACRHGGMTELEEAELTDGQGRSLSGHQTKQSYIGYAKQSEARALSATRKRYAHRQTDIAETSIQNAQQNAVQNDSATDNKKVSK